MIEVVCIHILIDRGVFHSLFVGVWFLSWISSCTISHSGTCNRVSTTWKKGCCCTSNPVCRVNHYVWPTLNRVLLHKNLIDSTKKGIDFIAKKINLSFWNYLTTIFVRVALWIEMPRWTQDIFVFHFLGNPLFGGIKMGVWYICNSGWTSAPGVLKRWGIWFEHSYHSGKTVSLVSYVP